MNFDEFDACFDRFEASTFRLEALQHYAIPADDADFAAFREGKPRPERSVRTSDWLRRVAVTTATGKRWTRVHVVEHPLSEYLQYEMAAYLENAATGEEIRIAERTAHPDLARIGPDFWLFDAETEHAFAVLMRYDSEGHMLSFDYADDAATLDRCCAERDIALKHSQHLNAYLAATGGNTRNVA